MSRRSWRLPISMSILLCTGLAGTEADDSLRLVDFKALRLAVRDLSDTYPERYAQGETYLRRLEAYEERLPQIRRGLERGSAKALGEARQILALKRQALLANPLLDFDKLLLIRRKPLGDPRRAKADGKGLGKVLGLPQQSSWQLDTMPNTLGWENDVAVLSPVRPEGTLSTVYRPAAPRLVSDVELHFDAGKLMFSMPIAFISTAALQGVPCNDAVVVGLTFVMDGDGGNVRQLCFDQDHNYCPTVMVDVGRYRGNAWGLHDMHGNVWQWTRSTGRPYPYRADDGRNDPTDQDRRVVRGGSWYDRPERCRSAFRLSYPAWRKVYNVGFRLVCKVKGDTEGHIAKVAD